MIPKKLNLGCGTDIRKGYHNVDIANLPGVDQVVDVTKLPFPFEDDYFTEVICFSILEHVDTSSLMKECYRILAPGGRLEIQVPHFTSSTSYTDPTHLRTFTSRTFDFYVKGNYREYYNPFAFTKTAVSRITLDVGLTT